MGVLGESADMEMMDRRVLSGSEVLGGAWLDSEGPRKLLPVSTLLGGSARSDLPEKPTTGSERVLGVSWMLAEVWTLGEILGTMGSGVERSGVTRTLEGALWAISEGSAGPQLSSVDVGG